MIVPTELTSHIAAHNVRYAITAFFALISIAYFFLWSHQPLRGIPESVRFAVKGGPVSGLPRIPNTKASHHFSSEELAIKHNVEAGTICGGIDVNSILHVDAAATLDPNLDIFLKDAKNYPELNLPASTWDKVDERAKWYHMNAVSRWRPKTMKYYNIIRIVYAGESIRSWPYISYLAWQEMSEDGTHGNEMHKYPIYIPQPNDGTPIGPEDPRVLEDPDGHICIFFSMLDIDGLRKIWFYNTTSDAQVALNTPKDRETQEIEKNWTPFIQNDTIKILYSYEPVTTMICDFGTGACQWDYARDHNPQISIIHGGSGWVPWKDSGYYISIGHAQIKSDWVLYRPNLLVLSPHDQEFRIAYASGPLNLDYVTLLKPFGVYNNLTEVDETDTDGGRILIAGSISRDDLFEKNSIVFTVTTGDWSTTILEVGGISEVMEAVIKQYELETSWHTDNGELIGCAETAAQKYYENVENAKNNG
ncbi:hypothetical protein MMC21_006333 [Puttea exsequens]|nr:hypothetical protein [Puttea exsequens]